MNRLQLTYRGFPPSEALSDKIREHADWLDETFDGIVACKVVVEQPHRHQQQGKKFHVNVVLEVPGREIAVTRTGLDRENPYQAVNDAFRAARGRLLRYVDLLRGEVKDHSRPAP